MRCGLVVKTCTTKCRMRSDKVRINCEKGAIGVIDSLTYDEMKDSVSKNHYDHVIMRKVFPGTGEERLLKEICK